MNVNNFRSKSSTATALEYGGMKKQGQNRDICWLIIYVSKSAEKLTAERASVLNLHLRHLYEATVLETTRHSHV